MRSPHYFVCEPKNGNRYDNKKELSGVDFIVSSNDEDHTVTNRIAVVKSVPLKYNGPIRSGDELIVHHNIFRVYHDMKGREKSSYAHLFGNVFMIDMFDIFAYRHPGEDFNAIAPYCFVAPIEKTTTGLLETNTQYEELYGTIVYPNEEQRNLKAGDVVVYKPHIEYEFNIDGVKMYRMKTNSICLVK